MSAITVSGELVHYEVLGRGRPVILLHGWLGSWRYWIPTMQQLHMKYRVYALDLFGFGDSSKARNAQLYTVQQQASMLDDFMQQLAIPRAAFIGHGLGAMIIAEYAFKHQKERVPRALLSSLPLYDIGGLDQRTPRRTKPKRGTFVPDDPDRTIPSSSLEKTIASKNSASMIRAAIRERAAARNQDSGGGIPSPIQPKESETTEPRENLLRQSLGTTDMSELLARCFRSSEVEYGKLQGDVLNAKEKALQVVVDGFDAAHMLDTIHGLEMPIVLVHGEQDPLVPVPNKAVWDYVSGGTGDTLTIPVPNVRHFPMLEHERFGRFVNDFLETPRIEDLEIRERWRRRSR